MSENEQCYRKFEKVLIKQDLSKRTIDGYLYDIRAFMAWLKDFYQDDIELTNVKTNDLQAYREYLVKIKRAPLRLAPSLIYVHIHLHCIFIFTSLFFTSISNIFFFIS